MGTTLSSVHIYTTTIVENESLSDFRTFSDGWYTYIPSETPDDPLQLCSFAKGISKRINAPVLWFYIFDSESIWFEFYQGGKRISAYSQEGMTSNKNLYGIPKLIGYEDGQKRRLSRILSCADIDLQLELLEEYFGVCLLPFPDMLDESPDIFHRIRSDKKYLALIEEDKKLTGKLSPFKAELVYERKGKLFYHHFGENDRFIKQHCYYLGYESLESLYQKGALTPVRFENGQLIPITQEEFDNAESIPRYESRKDDRFTEEYIPYKVHFTDKAPAEFRGKTLTTPRGFYFNWFDEKGRAILSDERGGIAIVDDSLKVVAKMRVKGEPVDYLDGYILTTGSRSFFEYGYYPKDAVRIYRICEK